MLMVLFALAVPQAAAAQTDGSVETVYARECAGNPATQLCATLSKSLSSSMDGKGVPEDTANSSQWGVFGKLAGTIWFNDTHVLAFNWYEPDRVLFMEPYERTGEPLRMTRFDSPGQAAMWGWYGGSSYRTPILEGGKIFYKVYNFLYEISPTGALVLTPGKFRSGIFSAAPQTRFAKIIPAPGEYRRMSASEESVFRSVVANWKARRDNSSGDQPSMFGAVVRGVAMGVSGVEAPLMNADGSEPNTLDVLNAANAELARQNAVGRAKLDASIARAREVSSGPIAEVGESAQHPAAGRAGHESYQGVPTVSKTSAQAYFVVGMTPTASNTRNPMCYSSAFDIEFERDPNQSGDNDRAQAALSRYETLFLEKCSRYGQVSGVVNGNVEGLTSGFPMGKPHAEDFVVTIP